MTGRVNFTHLRKQATFKDGIRLLLLVLFVQIIRPAPLPVLPGPQQTVTTTHPKFGIHTRLNDEVEPWKIKQSLTLVREAGAPYIVEFFPWAYHQPHTDQFNWNHADLIIDHAEAQGLTIIARLGLVPDWARPADTPFNYLEEASYDAFGRYAAQFAARYKGRVEHLIILNEPNLTFEWGGRTTTPADYVGVLRAAYPQIKAANPNAVVLAGALAPTLEPAGSPNGLNDLIYLDGMYANGAADYFDALAVHTYGLTFPPESEPAPDILNFRRVELIRDVMVAHGDEQTPIFITESGYNDHPRWTHAVRPSQRIQYTLAALEIAHTDWPYVEMMALWMLRTPAPNKNFLDYYTLITPEFINKPIYTELQRLTGNGGK